MKVKSPGKSERHYIVEREKEHRLLEVPQALSARPVKSRMKVNALGWLEAVARDGPRNFDFRISVDV
jgi:hypothetical protein